MKSPLYLCAALAATMGLSACSNPEVPAGHEGYVHYLPLIFGKMEYRSSLPGPASTGLSWRLFTINIDMRERNFPESFELLSKDDLRVSFEVNTRIRLRAGTVKEIVEQWGGENWYQWNVKEPLRTIVRTEVMKVDATAIQLATDGVSKNITEALEIKYKDTPIEIVSVDIGSFEFPKEVNAAIQEKIAKQQELERQDFILATTSKQAAINVFEALKVNKRQRIIGESLDPLYVQWQGVQVYRKLAESPNNTIIMLPNTAEGTGVPQILSRGKRKVVTPEDEQELADIEEAYRKKVKALDVKSGSATTGGGATEGSAAGTGTDDSAAGTTDDTTAPAPDATAPDTTTP